MLTAEVRGRLSRVIGKGAFSLALVGIVFAVFCGRGLASSGKWETYSTDQWKGAAVCDDNEVNTSCFAMRCNAGRGAEFTYFFSGGSIEIGRSVPVQIDTFYSDTLIATSGEPTSELNFAVGSEKFHGLITALRKGKHLTLSFDAPVKLSLSGSSQHLAQALKLCAVALEDLPLFGDSSSDETMSGAAPSVTGTEPVPLTPAAIQTLRHKLGQLGHSANQQDPVGIMDEALKESIAHWQQSAGTSPTGALDRTQLDQLFDIQEVVPVNPDVAQVEATPGAVPFIVLKSTTLGGVGEYRRHYEDPRLDGISFEQCMSECAADDRCDTVSYIHGCTLMSGIGYRHDDTGNFSSGAVVLSRSKPKATDDNYSPSTLDVVLDQAIAGFNPSVEVSPLAGPADLELPLGQSRVTELPDLTLRKKALPNNLSGEELVYGDLGIVKGRAKPFWLRDWVVISAAHAQAIEAYENLLRAGRNGQPDEATKAIVPMLEAARRQAEAELGSNHPALGFLVMDLAELSAEYTTALVPWDKAHMRKRELMREAAILLQGSVVPDNANQALLAEHAAIAWIETIRIDNFTSANPDNPAAAPDRIASQWGRCSENKDADLKRSDAILASLARHRDALGLQPEHIGWLKRATNCLTDDDRILELLRFRLALARNLDDGYAIAASFADLGHAYFNAGDLDSARKSFAASATIFRDRVMPRKSHFDFIQTVYSNAIEEDLEYYPEGSSRKREVWESLVALDMKPELSFVLALGFRSLIDEQHLSSQVKDYHMMFFARFLYAANIAPLSEAMFTHLDYMTRGTHDPSPVLGVLDLLDAGIQTVDQAFVATLLKSVMKWAESRSIPEEMARAGARLASTLNEQGDFEGAAKAARQALLAIKQHSLNTNHYDLDKLNLLITRAAREQGEVEGYAEELASNIQNALGPVCRGEQDLTALPWLPLDQLIDDPLLTEAFLRQPVVSAWLKCFFDNRHLLAFKDWSGGHLPADLLTDVMFVLGIEGRRADAELYLDDLVRDHSWSDDRGFGARLLAISAAIDGLVLAGRRDWFETYEHKLLLPLGMLIKSPETMGGRILDALTRFGLSAHSLGKVELVDQIAVVMRQSAHEFATGEYSSGRSCGGSCEFLNFYEARFGNQVAAKQYKKDLLSLDALYFSDETFDGRRKLRDAALRIWLHENAGRFQQAELYASALYLGEGVTKTDLLSNERPLNRAGNIQFATSAARIAHRNGDHLSARALARHFLTAARQRTREATIFGTDPLVRWSVRLGGLFETYLETSQFPYVSAERKSDNSEIDDAFFASQFLQTTNTASTFAKLSARIGKAEGADIRALQDVAENLARAYNDLLEESGDKATRSADEISQLERQRDALVAKVSDANPGALQFGGLQFPMLEDVQASLKSNEALISTVVGNEAVYIWLIRHNHISAFRLEETPEQLAAMIEKVREISNPQTIGLPINAKLLHTLYQSLFGKLESKLDGVENLIFIPHKSFDGLPLTILLTEPPSQERLELSTLRELKLPWLVRRFAVSIMPSVSSVLFLKSRKIEAVSKQKPFFGIGNPLLDSPLRLNDADNGKSERTRGGFTVENLPETEFELKQLAELFGANSSNDLLLGAGASETNIKARNLDEYDVIAFATHGMIANELPGIKEPSLILTVPEAGNSIEDGILFASEIAELKLDASLVILSACNTAAGSGKPGAEGLSGLANAFFFAGAQQLVVTHWHIPSEPAVEISTGMVEARQGSSNTDWPRALQKSILDLIDNKGDSYNAHPVFWGAHMLVGVPR